MTSHDDKVLDHTRQQLSALFDGELAADEGRFLQRRLEHDGELAACWSRWQLAGDVLRGQAVAAAPAGFADGVVAAVAAESAPAAVAARPSRRRGMLLPGAALAASVAALAMFMTRQAPDTAVPMAPAMEIASAADTVPAQPQPGPEIPAPATPAAPDALAAAGTAIAVAEVPRRAAERRSRGQQQRAAGTRLQRNAPEPRLVAAAPSGAQPSPAEGSSANPFVPEAAAEAITARPWPRALLPGGGGAFTVGYGRLQSGDAMPQAHPFQPRPVALPQTAADSTLSEDTD